MHTSVMMVTYLTGGLFACSGVWLLVSCFFLKCIKILMQPCKMTLKAFKKTAHTFCSQRQLNSGASLLGCGSVALVSDYKFSTKDDDF